MEIMITTTKLYDLLSVKIGKETAEKLLSYIKERISGEMKNNMKALATRDDFFALKQNILDIRAELKEELNKNISAVKVDMEKSFRSQFWLIIGLFIPLYLALLVFVFNVLRQLFIA